MSPIIANHWAKQTLSATDAYVRSLPGDGTARQRHVPTRPIKSLSFSEPLIQYFMSTCSRRLREDIFFLPKLVCVNPNIIEYSHRRWASICVKLRSTHTTTSPHSDQSVDTGEQKNIPTQFASLAKNLTNRIENRLYIIRNFCNTRSSRQSIIQKESNNVQIPLAAIRLYLT